MRSRVGREGMRFAGAGPAKHTKYAKDDPAISVDSVCLGDFPLSRRRLGLLFGLERFGDSLGDSQDRAVAVAGGKGHGFRAVFPMLQVP